MAACLHEAAVADSVEVAMVAVEEVMVAVEAAMVAVEAGAVKA